jgi:uncharacterized membrane protein YphA (DoxX/SURF4 family)
MLNPFPHLLDYQFFGPTLLRFVVGCYLLWIGYSRFTVKGMPLKEFFASLGLKPASYYVNTLGLFEILVALCLIAGFLTQIAAAILAVVSFVLLVVSVRYPSAKLRMPTEYLFLLTISLTLLVMGAGRIAIDWPL